MSRRCCVWIALLPLLASCSERIGHGWDWNRMREQPKAVTYSANAALPAGSEMQVPPAGTIAADSDDTPVPHGATRGAERYQIFCGVCHGVRGDGQSLMASNIHPPKPPSLLTGAAAALADATIDSVMLYGTGTMMGFGADIPAADRRAVIGYIRHLQDNGATRP